ncbi:hypothetical protein BSN85_25895 [Bradyrhizobium brasilense]|uniref:hypothetical protein n=1 Tax=Bradyrhizobium brasilense TaxID=1419277 RepID=UPI0009755F26|nr:hypothetical protein [Bradyrhizobium brasilense]OMI04907.1 hypothetical protein BSN85_25895 [Bradyrhizobium brasilense]
MRNYIVLLVLIALTGCTDVAAEAKSQYLQAIEKHRECVKANPGAAASCAGLLHEMEAREQEYIRLISARR